MNIFMRLMLFFFILSINFAKAAYEARKYPSYSIGDILTYSKSVSASEGITQATITEKLLDLEIKSGVAVEKWEIIETQTSPTVTVERTWEWRDNRGNEILADMLDDESEGGTSVTNTVYGATSSNPTIGSTIFNHSQVASATLNSNGHIFGGFGGTKKTGTLSKVTTVTSALGGISCFEIKFQEEKKGNMYNSTYGILTIEMSSNGTNWHSNKYGLVKKVITDSTTYNFTSLGNKRTTLETTTTSLISAQVSNSTSNSISSFPDTTQNQYDGWNWNKWPWVYNSNLDNWLYYYPSASGQYSVWNNKDQKWYYWNISQSSWYSIN